MPSGPPTPSSDIPKDPSDFRFQDISLPVEWVESYRPGGFHPVKIGDTFEEGHYEVLRKLGYGSFSTVWLAFGAKNHRYVVLKVSSARSDAAEKELKMLKHLSAATSSSSSSARNIVGLLDQFDHVSPNGMHHCMVLEVIGPSVAMLYDDFSLKSSQQDDSAKVPMWLAKSIIKQLLSGLHSLHACGIAHGDVQPGKVLSSLLDFNKTKAAVTAPEPPAYAGGVFGAEVSLDGAVNDVAAPSDFAPSSTFNAADQFPPLEGFSPPNGLNRNNGNVPKGCSEEEAATSDVNDGASSSIPAHEYKFSHLYDQDVASMGNAPFPARLPSPLPDGAGTEARLLAKVRRKDGKIDPWAPTELQIDQPLTKFTQIQPGLIFKLSDFGSSFFLDNPPEQCSTPIALRAPELVLGMPFDHRIDIWNFGCLAFEFLTMTHLFNVMPLGKDTKDEDDDDHLLQMHEVLGPMTAELQSKWSSCARYIGRDQSIIRSDVSKADVPEVDEIVHFPSLEEYFNDEKSDEIDEVEAARIVAVLRKCLQYLPSDRPSAEMLLQDPWVKGITV